MMIIESNHNLKPEILKENPLESKLKILNLQNSIDTSFHVQPCENSIY